MFAEFGRVSVLCVLERCSVVSVSSLEAIFCKSDICLSVETLVLVTTGDTWCCPHVRQWLGRLVMTGGSFHQVDM